MNTTKLKRFATEARNKLRLGVEKRLAMLGFDDAGLPAESPKLVSGGAVWKDKPCTVAFYNGFKSLEEQIRRYGVSHVVEEAAYTWFNRLMAIRILTMNELCEPALRYVGTTRTPLIVDEARQGHIPEMDEDDREALMTLIDDDTKTAEQFAMLISAFCHNTPLIAKCFSLGGGAPSRRNDDYTDLLFPANILNPEGFLDSLNTTDFITEADYHSSELLGWLYQFYISEKKDQVFAKKGKYDADDIPAATQIFTPNWIVKYMVQNAIIPQLTGKSGALAASTEEELKERYRYLVITPDFETARGRASSQLEDLKVADLACGSGHILNECFDLLYDLYISEGYTRREAIECIFTRNLTGIDIDTRAKQLATFALMLKACQRDSSLVDASLMPHVYDMSGMPEESRELGSIQIFDEPDSDNPVIAALSTHYDAIVMNPPYMPTNRSPKLREYTLKHYFNYHIDLFATFMKVAINRLKIGGRYGMLNMQSWAFLSSYEELRDDILKNNHIDSFIHLGAHTFDELNGEIVQNIAFVVTKGSSDRKAVFYRLVEGQDCEAKELLFERNDSKYTNVNLESLKNLPGQILAYWLSDKAISIFKKSTPLENHAYARVGMFTGDNNRFLREWWEVSSLNFNTSCENYQDSLTSDQKWYPYNKGGRGRRWYGNYELVVNYLHGGDEIYNLAKVEKRNCQDYPEKFKFVSNITWSTAGADAFRYQKAGTLFDTKGMSMFVPLTLEKYILGFTNSSVGLFFLKALSPSTDTQVGQVRVLPLILSESQEIDKMVENNISISCKDWDAHETSWDFGKNPLLAVDVQTYMDNIDAQIEKHRQETGETLCIDPAAPQLDSLKWRYEQYCQKWESLFMKLHANEEELNRRFIEIYGLQDELTPDVPFNEVTILQQGEISWEEARPRAVDSDGFLKKDQEIAIHGERMPHWNQSDTYVFFTFRLGDSLPKEKQEEIKSKRDIWMKDHPLPWDEETEREYHRSFTHKVEEWIDKGYGSCILKDPKASSIVLAIMQYDDGKKYDLINYVIMPNHVHALVRIVGETKVEDIMQEWKSVSSHKLRKQFGSEWCGWMEKYHDRIIRNQEHFNNVIGYIYKNYSHGGVKTFMDGENMTARGRASSRLVWHPEVIMKQFISYAVGCMMGRYRLDRPGLAIAHPNETLAEVAEYRIPDTDENFWIDEDAIIPLMPEDCGFHDNAVNRFATFVRQTLGEQTQVENLNFIEECLGKSLEQYFIKDFWKDHKKMYQNRPIYWLFASKKGAFQVLVYVHRMNVATVERIRSRYLLPYIERLNKRIEDLQANESTLSTRQRNQLKTLRTQVAECEEYHNRLAVVAERGIVPNLDDGILKNHALYGDVVTKLK